VDRAYRLRLHLEGVGLPGGVQMWVYNDDGSETVGPFGLELLDPQGGLWTPSVAGPTLHFELSVPASALAEDFAFRFNLDQVLVHPLLPHGESLF
jgi:hypothetical protein